MLNDPLALATLGNHTGAAAFADCERMVAALDAGLWGRAARVEAGAPGLSRRTMIASGTILLPPTYPGVSAICTALPPRRRTWPCRPCGILCCN